MLTMPQADDMQQLLRLSHHPASNLTVKCCLWRKFFKLMLVMMTVMVMLLPVTESSLASSSSSPHPAVRIKCSEKMMEVTVEDKDDVVIYLDKLKGYPGCHPEMIENKAVFQLPLDDNFYSCGTTRIQNKMRDVRIFYNRVIIEQPKNNSQEVVVAKCVLRNDLAHHHISRFRRQLANDWELPENFTESIEELIDYSGNITEHAPIPYLNIGVRQNGRFVDTALNVHPGTPLEMVIYLDETSAPVYGLLARYLKVTDNTPRKQEETIILEGCSIDPYIFSNFETNDGGDSIVAKFRAFKFPESNYVLFVGTVNVCLKECLGVLCGNNQLGFGRRRRSIISDSRRDPNKIFEIQMTAFLKVDSLELDGGPVLKGSAKSAGSTEDEKIINRRDELKQDSFNKHKWESRSLPLKDMLQTKSTSRKSQQSSLETSSGKVSSPASILIIFNLIIFILTSVHHHNS